MTFTRRHLGVTVLASALAAFGLPSIAHAEGSKTVHMLVGYAPGGAADTVARTVADGMRDAGYTVLVENKAGASGRLATEAAAQAPADGSVILMAPLGNLTLQPHTFPHMRVDTLHDLRGVGSAASMGFAWAVRADNPARNLQDYLARARKDPGQAAYGTPGAGTAMHFLGVMLSQESKTPLTHVAYKGGSAAINDLLGGTLPAVSATLPALLPMERAGKIRILAVANEAPVPGLEQIPTFKSQGFPGLVVTETFAFFAPAKTPDGVVQALNRAIGTAVASPRVKATLEKLQFTPDTMSPQALDKKVREEYGQWGRTVKTSGYKPEQ